MHIHFNQKDIVFPLNVFIFPANYDYIICLRKDKRRGGATDELGEKFKKRFDQAG